MAARFTKFALMFVVVGMAGGVSALVSEPAPQAAKAATDVVPTSAAIPQRMSRNSCESAVERMAHGNPRMAKTLREAMQCDGRARTS
ncbi:MAG TPA: hypothetical protein VK996_19545 [Ramlibacter sp.]|nr:hypothetical protein [Ramlibacter sp.]